MNRSLVTILLMGALSISESSYAVNWLALQGTERPEAPRSRLFGYAWIDYQDTDDGKVPVGPFAGREAVFNQIGPQLDSSSQVTARRLRLGVRGLLRNKNLNYLLRLQSGDNGVTRLNQGNRVRLVEASLTLNHISGARVRVGMFKYPGSEEGLQIIPPRDYINFTNMTNQLLLERFFASDGSNPLDENSPGPAGIFRDFGVMVFDAFKMKAWEHTYAAMVSNGAGVSVSNLSGSNDDEDIYLYWSSEKVFGGKGIWREGLKLYAWTQDGQRELRVGPSQTEQEFDRRRFGIGTTFCKGRFRAGFELVKAEGVIPAGADGGAVPGSLNNAGTAVASFNVLPNDEARGWYIDFGYRVKPKWWLDVRFDRLNSGTDTDAGEREFETITIGTQYYFSKKMRIMFNYEFREAEAPNLPSTANPNQILDEVDDRFSVQFIRFL